MEPQVINHEILLFTGSSFCSRKLCKRTGDDESPHDLSSMEELEKACWNGMLLEMLPELVGKSMQRRNNYIWRTASGVNFLCINMGCSPVAAEKQASIDPYFFLYGAAKN